VRPQLRFVLLAASVALAVGLVLVVVLSGSPSHSVPQSSDFDGAVFPAGVHAHDLTLSNQHGQSVSLGDYRGQVVVLAFLSSNCRVCVLVAQQVRGALDELEPTPHTGAGDSGESIPGVQTIFVSTDPTTDTPKSVSRFLDETSLSGRVEYLTGTTTQLRPVWHDYGIAPVSRGKSASEAGTTVLLIDGEGTERVGFGLEQITPEGLAHDIRLLQATTG